MIKIDNFSFYNSDNLEIMKTFSDNEFDLAIVDPPYGIDKHLQFHETGTTKNKMYEKKRWDKNVPESPYWKELFRISKNQIVFGGNYFTNFLPPSRGWYVWHKLHEGNLKYSHVELIWTSFEVSTKLKTIYPDTMTTKIKAIHPTQKPVAIYEWLIKCFSKQNYKIIDTHLGSASIALAVDKVNKFDNMNLSLTGIELDSDYFDSAIKRFNENRVSATLNFSLDYP